MIFRTQRHRGGRPGGDEPFGLDPNAIADGFSQIIRDVEVISVRATGENAARMVYDQRLRDKALALFDQACALGYSSEADRAKIEHPPLLMPSGLLLALLSRLEQYARSVARTS